MWLEHQTLAADLAGVKIEDHVSSETLVQLSTALDDLRELEKRRPAHQSSHGAGPHRRLRRPIRHLARKNQLHALTRQMSSPGAHIGGRVCLVRVERSARAAQHESAPRSRQCRSRRHVKRTLATDSAASKSFRSSAALVDGGWPQGHEAEENLHTLLEVHADDGLSGVGSCFTSGALVAVWLLLWPLLEGEIDHLLAAVLGLGSTLSPRPPAG